MSYSFQVRGATKALVLAALAAKFAEIVKQQPVHAVDQDAVLANGAAAVAHLVDDEAKDVLVTVSGSLAWSGGVDGVERKFTGVSISASAGLAERPEAQPA